MADITRIGIIQETPWAGGVHLQLSGTFWTREAAEDAQTEYIRRHRRDELAFYEPLDIGHGMVEVTGWRIAIQ